MAVLAAAVVGLAAGEPAPLCVCFAATVRVRARPPPRLPCLCASAGSATRKHSTPPARLPPQSQRPRGSPAPAGALTRTRLRTRRHVHPDLRRRMGSTELFCYGRRGLGRSQGLPRDEKSQAQHVRRLPGVLPVLLHPSANVARVPLRSVGRVATCCSVCAPCRALRGEASCDGAQSSLERRGRPCLRAVRMCASYSDAGDPPMRRHPRALARPNRPDRLHPRTQALATDAAKAAKEGVEQTYKGITNSTCETGMAKEWCQVRARALSLSLPLSLSFCLSLPLSLPPCPSLPLPPSSLSSAAACCIADSNLSIVHVFMDTNTHTGMSGLFLSVRAGRQVQEGSRVRAVVRIRCWDAQGANVQSGVFPPTALPPNQPRALPPRLGTCVAPRCAACSCICSHCTRTRRTRRGGWQRDAVLSGHAMLCSQGMRCCALRACDASLAEVQGQGALART